MQPLNTLLGGRGARGIGSRGMSLLLDMNIAPGWVAVLAAEGHEAVHWSSIHRPSRRSGPRAPRLGETE